ncbi:hypothetical protein RHMOL_Rhmol13G0033400 [Rhododendron molle]|uniref:Uncharacterized protein n=1 Tax=Rhododendron molle TaxID=49168 RepID=A0ACC0L409_RHOML|nr:hypothetical protein RHMOL_Rhmol13G0033400 [Rhododendron molle]
MNDGRMSISAYDTAWVALVEDLHGNGGPQFPKCLEWISNNQLPDGSWGDALVFKASDRLISTLACVIALKSWNIRPDKSKKGMEFVKENIHKLKDENEENMLTGFEVAFPSLIEIGHKLDIKIPVDHDSRILQEIYARRNLKLARIPKDIMHREPTPLLYSLEGMQDQDLDWEKLLKFQFPDGSFCTSPSSTAFALMQTKDENCLRYLSTTVETFDGGVPNVYPVDILERLWAVDRLQRLGISRFFQSEVTECLDYVYRSWTEQGVFSASNSTINDIDDTAMGFRLLRLRGYQVSADVFRHFEKDGEFFCLAGQSTQGVTPMYNLYRASQIQFPEEKILEDAKKFTSKFLREKQASNKLLDKWVGYALDVPWYASLPRVETRFYLDQYGGADDVWIGKTLYRLHNVSSNNYLELAKLDYKNCQGLHLREWNTIHKWYTECNLEQFGMSKRDMLFGYYLATASIYEPERAKERLAWAQTRILMEAVVFSFEKEGTWERSAFLREFKKRRSDYVTSRWDGKITRGQGHGLVAVLLGTLNRLLSDAHVVQDREIFHHHLHQTWETWITTWQEDGDMRKGEAELLVSTINLCANFGAPEKLSQLSHPRYKHLNDIANGVCFQLLQFQHQRPSCNKIQGEDKCNTTLHTIESGMQELVQLVVCASSDDIDSDIKQTFLAVAKSYYYAAYFVPATIDFHIAKVLLERVV